MMAASASEHRQVGAPTDVPAARPFVKWVGGKRQLLPHLLPLVRTTAPGATYHEPFIGGGAVFFAQRAEMPARSASIADANAELTTAYRVVRDDVEALLRHLRKHEHANDIDYFYKVRAARPTSDVDVAARLIYLNKTCFNGLYRVNGSGGFNSPWGYYEKPTICDSANLRSASAALADVDVTTGSFESVLERARAGDVVYFDPPYVPLSATASFTGYCAGGFGPKEQLLLADVARELDKKAVRVVLSNSSSLDAKKLYKGFRVARVDAKRAVNSRADRRGPIAELLIRNF